MLTLQYLKYSDIESLSSSQRIKKILGVVKKDSILLMEGRLKKTEEAELIQKTMESISSKFKGIELAVIESNSENDATLQKIKKNVINFLLGDRQGMTIIGPANIVKEIKQDPNKIQLIFEESNKKVRR